jgi:ParB family transcriptional regulator, chromosome partitioning protein
VSKRGLPLGVKMRHDAHYVDELASRRPTPVGRLIALDKIDPNPEQPRVEIGDLTDLTASIKEKGVLEPLLVKPSRNNARWMIIAGERRWRAAREAGLREVPCIELDVDDRAVAEIALIENLQRKDLTVWEEADGLKALCEKFGYTHEEVARKVGKGRTSVTESLSIAGLPEAVREKCRRADISSKSLILQIVRQPDEEGMWTFLEQVVSRGMTRDDARAARRSTGTRPVALPFVYRYEHPSKQYKIEVRFRKSQVDPKELAEALQAAAEKVLSKES